MNSPLFSRKEREASEKHDLITENAKDTKASPFYLPRFERVGDTLLCMTSFAVKMSVFSFLADSQRCASVVQEAFIGPPPGVANRV